MFPSLQNLCSFVIKENNIETPKCLEKLVQDVKKCCIRQEDNYEAIKNGHVHCIRGMICKSMVNFAIDIRQYKVLKYFIFCKIQLPNNLSLRAIAQGGDLELVQFCALYFKLHPFTLNLAAQNGFWDIVKFCSLYLPVDNDSVYFVETLQDEEMVQFFHHFPLSA
jgi:hypothetical protein